MHSLCAAGEDYEAINGTLTFHAPACTAKARVVIVDDTIYESRETFYFTLAPTQARVTVNQSIPHGNISIIDNDGEAFERNTARRCVM